jgi:hypothetical protein
MSDRAKKISELTELTSPALGDFVIVTDISANASKKVALSNLFGNCNANLVLSNTSLMSANVAIIRNANTPANSSITVTRGTIWFDSDFLYVATANNILKRVALESF